MPGFGTLGTLTPPAIFLTVEIHKLHMGFVAGSAIHHGQPCKIQSDGTVIPMVSGTDDRDLLLGYGLQECNTGDDVTLVMRGYMTQNVISGGAVACGPVKYNGWDGTNLRSIYAPATVGTDKVWGHNVDSGISATGNVFRAVLLP